MTKDELIAFEDDIAREFAAGNIRAPIHLSGGNEDYLIDIFRDIGRDDWLLCSWRSHYHCLLKGVPPVVLKARIMAGHSVALCFPDYKILSSGIVGGTAPIAVGLAWGCKQRNDNAHNHETRVHCFIGDMTATAGIVYEAQKYAACNALPIKWWVEDNGKSVCTDTKKSWGENEWKREVERYEYTLTRPHSGIGQWIRF
jgi:pyruvate dehydrogenase E1 component alpha subunit